MYPDTVGDIPALSAEEWLDGKNAQPILVSSLSLSIIARTLLELYSIHCVLTLTMCLSVCLSVHVSQKFVNIVSCKPLVGINLA